MKKSKMGNFLKCTRSTNPSASDKSTKLKAPSVSKDACRRETAKYPKTLGPRTA